MVMRHLVWATGFIVLDGAMRVVHALATLVAGCRERCRYCQLLGFGFDRRWKTVKNIFANSISTLS